MFKKVFGELLQKHNLTAYRVAKETGISQGTMNEYKNGIKTPSPKNLQKNAEYFSVSVDYLLGKEKPQVPKHSGLSENTILICRGGETKTLHFTPEQLETIEKMLNAIEPKEKSDL